MQSPEVWEKKKFVMSLYLDVTNLQSNKHDVISIIIAVTLWKSFSMRHCFKHCVYRTTLWGGWYYSTLTDKVVKTRKIN